MIRVGELLNGYCNGYFGRDSYEDKRIEAVGYDWVVARGTQSHRPLLATFDSNAEMEVCMNGWIKNYQP